MPRYVYRYFNIKALGEAPRMLFAYGKQEFEDIRVQSEEWPAYRPHTPYGQLPVLEIDGRKFAKGFAIARYLGHKFGLAGDTLEDALAVDQIVDYINDLRIGAVSAYYEEDETIKEKKYKDYGANLFPVLLTKLDAIIAENNGHLALGKLTWADFVLTGLLDYLKMLMHMPDLDKKYPNIKKLVNNVVSIPQVKAYIDKAPKLQY